MAVSQSHWKLRESGRQHQSRSITSAALFPAAPPAHRCNKSMSMVLVELPSIQGSSFCPDQTFSPCI